jgi:hypothetical protein
MNDGDGNRLIALKVCFCQECKFAAAVRIMRRKRQRAAGLKKRESKARERFRSCSHPCHNDAKKLKSLHEHKVCEWPSDCTFIRAHPRSPTRYSVYCTTVPKLLFYSPYKSSKSLRLVRSVQSLCSIVLQMCESKAGNSMRCQPVQRRSAWKASRNHVNCPSSARVPLLHSQFKRLKNARAHIEESYPLVGR